MGKHTVRALLLLLGTLFLATPAGADDIAVPIALQTELLVKVAAYDKNLPARAGDRVRVLVLAKNGNADSSRASAQIAKALGDKTTIAGLPNEVSQGSFSDAPALAKSCREKPYSIIYFTPGFSDDELAAIAKALDGVDVLTASAVADFVPKGIVLGFDLVSGKPKLLANLGQARRQKVALSADVLKLMKVYE